MDEALIALFKPPSLHKNIPEWLLQKLIQWRTWSPWTHAGIILSPEERLIISATWPKIKMQHVNEWPHGTIVEAYRVECTLAQAYEVKKWFLDREGMAGYDVRGLLGFLVRGRIQNPNKWFCSEAVVQACYDAGIDLFSPKRCPAWKVSPGKLRWSPRLRLAAVWQV